MKLAPYLSQDGLEFHIDEKGDIFATVSSMARMIDKETIYVRRHVDALLQNGDKLDVLEAETLTVQGTRMGTFYGENFIISLLEKHKPSLLIKMARLGLRLFVYELVGYSKVKEHPVLPPVQVTNFVDALKWLGVEADNPRYSQLLKDSALTILGVGKVETVTQKYCGVVERAEQLGYSTKQINGGSQLGKFVNKLIQPAHKENRLCQGTLRPINVFEVSDNLDDVIRAWFEPLP
jgi:hypothetical protein